MAEVEFTAMGSGSLAALSALEVNAHYGQDKTNIFGVKTTKNSNKKNNSNNNNNDKPCQDYLMTRYDMVWYAGSGEKRWRLEISRRGGSDSVVSFGVDRHPMYDSLRS